VPLESVTIVAAGISGLDAAVARGALDGRATNLARWLSDEPGNLMTPTRLADAAAAVLDGSAVQVQVLDEHQIGALNMGLITGVGRGSAEPPRLIVMRYAPANPGTDDRVLGFVGKGVTFDTGGISIKTAEGMEKMKHDMSGGAAVIAAMYGVAQLKPARPVIGVVASVENMPGGRAFKPGDILTGASGKSVEIVNTDAEGRLILGDALWYARQQGATHLVDVATLTGACVVALGKVCSGLFGGPDDWVDEVKDAASRVGERYWRLPADDDYADLLKSEYADIVNAGGRAGGAIAGAMFLREFAMPAAWAHLDVAGTAWADDARPFQPKGATGVTVRTLIELASAG
jgi:leucyl aminopeptidase